MIRFQNTEYLYALALIPVLILIYIWAMKIKQKSLRTFGDINLMKLLIPDLPIYKNIIKFTLPALALSLIILGLANLQVGSKLEEVKREGVDIIIALDVSNSMKAEDIKPNRLESAKREISQLIDKLQNDRIGLVVFAGQAYLQLPLTPDYSAAKLLVSTVETDIVPVQGTAIGAAIRLAMKSFVAGEQKHKVIVIITDGENHEDDAIAEAQSATDEGVIVHTIGMGSPLGTPLPLYQNRVQVGYKKDKDGNIILTKLDELVLQQIAQAGNGKYISAANGRKQLETILDEIALMEKKEYASKIYTEYEDRFQYFLGFALFFLIMDFFISERKNKWISKWNLFGEVKK
jgi:Ca-activated chloride channel family protein